MRRRGSGQGHHKVFETKLRYNCRADTPEDHDFVLASLKAFGNLGFAGSAKPVLDRCISSEELTTEVRVMALTAFRRMKCSVDVSYCVFLCLMKLSSLRVSVFQYEILMTIIDACDCSVPRR
jgi:hypothetical protein